MVLERKHFIDSILNLVFGMGAVLCLIAKIARMWVAIEQHSGLDQYKFFYSTTWLVDYSAGYVRRGLCGTIIRWIYENIGVEPQWVILLVVVVFFVTLTILAFLAMVRSGLCWWPLTLTICLGGMETTDRDGLTLLLCVLIVWLASHVKKIIARYTAVCLIGIIAVHIHEMSFFVAMPVLCLLAFWDDAIPVRPIFRPIVLLPIVCAFISISLFSGYLEISQQISSNWKEILPPWWKNVELRGVRWDVGMSAKQLLQVCRCNMFSFWHCIPKFVLFFAEVIAAFLVVCRLPFFHKADEVYEQVLPVLLLIQLVPIMVVFPFFCDYSRLFCYWTFPTLMYLVLVPKSWWQRFRYLHGVRGGAAN